MKFLRLLCLLPALVILLATCKEASAPTDANGNPTGNVTTTLAGIVTDESGQPLFGVAVIANGKNAVTDKYGTFMIQNANVPGNRCVILCKKNGYFTGSRAEVPKGGGITELRLTMQSSAPGYTVNSSIGGTLTIGTASVKFPPSAFVTSDGKLFTGTVKVAAKHLDPSQNSFYNSFSGDMTARRTDGTLTELLSYGVIRVRLTDDAGNELKLAAGKTATLTYPIAQSQQKNAPASMPLWYFDEVLGMWKEEGVAVKSGDVYMGEVAHFTSWNCDVPAVFGRIKGRVICKSEGLERIYITVGQTKVVSSTDGYFSCRVPINTDITISINKLENNGLSSKDIIVSPVNSNEERNVTIQIDDCPSFITGDLTDCSGNPICGIVIVIFQNGFQFACTTTGEFKMYVPTGVPFTILAITSNGKEVIPTFIGPLKSGEIKNVGRILYCQDSNDEIVTDINLGELTADRMILSHDGSLLSVAGILKNQSGQFIDVYNTRTGMKLWGLTPSTTYPAIFNFSADGKRMAISWFEDSTYVVNSQTGEIIQKFIGVGRAKISPDGNTIITSKGEKKQSRSYLTFSLYSVSNGWKIKDYSFNQFGYWNFVGITNTNQLVLYDIKWDLPRGLKIVYFDIESDKISKNSFIEGVGTFGAWSLNNGNGFSPDLSVVYLRDCLRDTILPSFSFYNTLSGEKLNSTPLAFNPDVLTLPILGFTNDLTYTYQAYEKDSTRNVPLAIYSVTDLKLKKILNDPKSIKPFYYYSFTASFDGQYMAGLIKNDIFSQPIYNEYIRIWKVK